MQDVLCRTCGNKIASWHEHGTVLRIVYAKGRQEFVASGGGLARVWCRWNDCQSVNIIPLIPVQTVSLAALLTVPTAARA